MANDRYDNRGGGHDDHRNPPLRSGRDGDQGDNDRGFFDRARDEVSSWFGDDEAERRRFDDDRGGQMGGGSPQQGQNREHEQHRPGLFSGGQSSSYGRGRDGGDYRNQYGRGGGESGGFGGGNTERQSREYPPAMSSQGNRDRSEYSPPRSERISGQQGGSGYQSGSGQSRQYQGSQGQGQSGESGQRQGGDGYRPMTGDYGRSLGQSRYGSGMGGQDFQSEQYGRQELSQDQDRDRGSMDRGAMGRGAGAATGGAAYAVGGWGDQDSKRQSAIGGGASGGGRHDEHYSSWRQRQIDELDRDYDAYRQEHQSKFENEFGGWRQQRQTKRQMLQSIREHFEVVDQSGEHIGTVDKVRGETVILTRNDPEAGGVHRSFSCSLLESVEGNRVTLAGTKDSLRSQIKEERNDERGRDGGEASREGGILGGLFGSSDKDRTEQQRIEQRQARGETDDGPHILDQSFSGTYDEGDKKPG